MSSAAEKAWSGLVRAALLGTERAEAGAMESISAADPRLASITPGLADRTPEARLLGTAGLLAQYRRVGGVVAVTAEPALTPAEPERARAFAEPTPPRTSGSCSAASTVRLWRSGWRSSSRKT